MIVELTKAQRGVGDLELRNASGERKWISGKVYSSSDTLPTGYVKYGVIYGFEKYGAAMLVSLVDVAPSGTLFCETDSATLPDVVADNASSDWGIAVNGLGGSNSYKCMNMAQVKSLCKTGAVNTTPTTNLTNANYGSASGPNSEAVFLANEDAVNKFGTYDAYLAQVRPLLKGAAAGVFSKRCGKENTKALAESTAHDFAAAKKCYNYVVEGGGDVVGNWWLPDMYELAVMMADEHYDLHSPLSGVFRSGSYWSSVVRSTSFAWGYYDYGLSSNHYFTSTRLRGRAVTLSL